MSDAGTSAAARTTSEARAATDAGAGAWRALRAGVVAASRLAIWTAALLVAARLLIRAGTGSLAVPLGSVDDLSAWVSDTPTPDMTIALLRLAALGATFYLLAVTAAAVVAGAARLRRLGAVVDRVTPGIVRRLVVGGSGLGFLVGGAVGAAPALDVTGPGHDATVAAAPAVAPAAPSPEHRASATMTRSAAPSATMRRVDPGAAGEGDRLATDVAASPASDDVASSPAAQASMVRLDASPSEASATMTRLDAPAAGPERDRPGPLPPPASPAAHRSEATLPAAPAAPRIDPSVWVVEPADSFWSIAEEVVGSATGGAHPDERTVRRYWRRLIDANRSVLVDPGNPDLLVPGQRLHVPPADA